ncbi:cellulose biosynthesis protein BcsO [Buttiauxella sp. B2]|uniref:cellulose biosynthesis protein BcsO n=1 Tax=Buttiauxella sp. B2 TaxID=2587812 RepID=UPI00111DFD89|nr:cellulose biosynthesis protein BcsO [Buttiauxella sp. B2]TNV21299.1 cellulose biosynthesis protein BcsO [Buttiauxella sp. B2]
MKNYDDLQRFKDKTRTGAIEFKDMSAQNQQSNASNWAIIKQLMNTDGEESVFSQAGSISVPAPQAAKADEFDTSHFKPLVAQPINNAVSQGSILDSLSSAMPQARTEVFQPEQNKSTAATLFEQLAPLTAAAEPIKEVVKPAAIAAPQAPAPVTAEPVRFDKLFAAKGNTVRSHPAKDLPLQPLLEMIASCR